MQTIRELVYLCLDELKGMSNDFTYTEEHIMFLLAKYRAFILKQRYADIRKQVPLSNYQTIKFDLIETDEYESDIVRNTKLLKSSISIPYCMTFAISKFTLDKYFSGELCFVSRDRFKYVGSNKYVQNIIYVTISADGYAYFKSNNKDFLYLEKAKYTTVFGDALEPIPNLDNEYNEDVLDYTFPIEDSLVAPIIELVVKELSQAIYRPDDNTNNDKDDLSDVNIKK